MVLDACVLVGASLCDLYLKLAEEPRLYRPIWSEAILDEVKKAQMSLKNPYPQELAEYWREQVTAAFPEAMITGWEVFLPAMTNHEDDKHVLATAVKGRASTIVTFNLKHFPQQSLKQFGVEAVHPQDYLLALWSISQPTVIGKLLAISRRRNQEIQDTLIHLGKTVPRFSAQVIDELGC